MLGWELPPHNSGGLGVACYQFCQALSNRDIDIEFVLPYHAQHDVSFMNVRTAIPQDVLTVVKAGIAYDSYRYIYSDGNEEWVDIFGQQFAYEQSVAQLVDETEFDIIHAHDWLTFRAALRAKEASGKTLIVHVHSIESDRAGGGYGNHLVREIEAQTMLIADRIIAVSEHTKKAIVRDYNIPYNKIEVVHNSIDVGSVEPLDNKSAYRYLAAMKTNGYRVVVNVGRLTLQKGVPNLLRAAKHVIERAPKTIFLIVGTGEQDLELIQLAAELGISKNVIFTGFLRGKTWRDAFAIGDLFVLPSISEPFGLTPLEAIGYGTPALISKQSGISEVIKNCLRVDYWNIHEMANLITAVIQNDALRDELHANAYKEFQRLSWNNAADRTIEVYKQHLTGALA